MLFIFYTLLLTNNILVQCEKDSSGDDEFDLGNNLADTLKNDANLDLSVDEEYEDLRAEFLAYRSALASLTASESGRRSMLSTACWNHSGICINHELCKGFRSLSQVPGCKDKLKVCCFVWDNYNVRDHKPFGISNIAMPWSLQQEFGGPGVVVKKVTTTRRPRKNRLKKVLRMQLVKCHRPIGGQGQGLDDEYIKIPNTYKDIFLPGSSGKITLGSPKATCWARGGICIKVQHCQTMSFDPSVAGCTTGHRVCCRIHKLQPPTVGSERQGPDIVVAASDLDGLDDDDLVKEAATANSQMLNLLFNAKLRKVIV